MKAGVGIVESVVVWSGKRNAQLEGWPGFSVVWGRDRRMKPEFCGWGRRINNRLNNPAIRSNTRPLSPFSPFRFVSFSLTTHTVRISPSPCQHTSPVDLAAPPPPPRPAS